MRSRSGKRNRGELGACLAMFEAISDDTKREHLDARLRFVLRGAKREDARQIAHFGNPPAVGLSFKLD
jgi:hypothetical protein